MKTQQSRKAILVALLAMIASACSRPDEGPVTPMLPADNIIRVATNINTRAGLTTENLRKFRFSVAYAPFGSTGVTADDYAKIPMYRQSATRAFKSYTDPTHTEELSMRWKDHITPAVLAAFTQEAPMVSGYEIDISVATDQSTDAGIEQSDFCHFLRKDFIPSKDLVDGKVPITLKHKNAKFVLTINLGSEFNSTDLSVNPISTFTIGNARLEGKFNIMYDRWGANLGQNGDITPYLVEYSPGNGTTQNATAVYQCVIIPSSSNLTFSAVVAGKEYRYVADYMQFNSGVIYRYTLNLGHNSVSVSQMGFAEWGDGGSNNIVTD